MENYTFKSKGHTYNTKNAIRIMTTTIFDEFFSDVVEVVLWRTEDGLYYFTLEDIVGDGSFIGQPTPMTFATGWARTRLNWPIL